MRFAILSVLGLAGTVFANGIPVNQISDGMFSHFHKWNVILTIAKKGQIQGQPNTPATTETTPAAYTPPPAYGSNTVETTVPVVTTSPVETSPVETSSVVTTPTPEVTTTTSAVPVTTTTTPLASYPLPNNTTVPLTTGAPVPSSYSGGESPSATEGSPVGSKTPQPASPNAAGIFGVQMGLTGVAVAGLLFFLA